MAARAARVPLIAVERAGRYTPQRTTTGAKVSGLDKPDIHL